MNPHISKIRLTNFKSHISTELETGNLTLLTGLNSSGKSSLLQSLLLLRQSHKKGRLKKGLDLNEPLCRLGLAKDVLSIQSTNDMIGIEIYTSKGACYNMQFDASDYDSSFIESHEDIEVDVDFSLFSNNFQYISASRWANLSLYPLDTFAVEKERQISLKYGQGELLAHYLEYYGENRNFKIETESILHPNHKDDKNLLTQAIAWEQEISPRVNFGTKRIGDQISIYYGFDGEGTNEPLKELKAENIGYGISYSLSVVVALLSATPGSLLLLENPEAHLHPSGQSKLAELIALTAQSGVQVIVETHSDHIFNGIRKAIYSKQLDTNNKSIYFFELGGDNSTIVTPIRLSNKGKILSYTDNMFDQFDKDLDFLLDI